MWQTSGDILWGSKRYFDSYCGNYEIISVTITILLKTQIFEKKGFFFSEEKWTVFLKLSSMINLKEHFMGSTRFSGTYYGINKTSSWGPRKSIETNISKNRPFTITKTFGPFLVVLSSVTSLGKQYMGVHKLIWQLLWNLSEQFFKTSEVTEIKNFWKKGKTSIEKNIVAFFSRSIEHDKSHGTILYGSRR